MPRSSGAHHDPRAVAEAQTVEPASHLADDPIGEHEVVQVAPDLAAEVPRRETFRGLIVDAWRLRNRQVEKDKPEAVVDCGADRQVGELGNPLGEEPTAIRWWREACPLVPERLTGAVAVDGDVADLVDDEDLGLRQEL